MKKSLLQILKIVLYTTFFVPLVVMPTSFIFPFIVPKILLFRSLVEVAALCYTFLLFINWEEFRPRFTPISIAVLLFLLSFGISTFFGVDPYHSFWDNHERMLGFFTLFHFGIYFIICSATFKSWKDWRGALLVFLSAGSIAMIVGVFQIFNPDLLLNNGSVRVASTLGNPIYVSGYGLFIFFMALLIFLREKDVLWKWLSGAYIVLGVLGVLFGGSRGALFGLTIGVGLTIAGYALFLSGHKKLRIAFGSILFLGLATIGLLYVNRQAAWIRDIPALDRSLSTTREEFQKSPRAMAWHIAFTSWKEHPFIGWGPNNFFYAFNKYYDPHLLENGYGETWFDNAHNIIMNTLTVQGVFGLLTYLGIFAIAIISLWKAWRESRLHLHITILGTAFLVGHLLQNITVFENPTSYLYFMFTLAFLSQVSDSKALVDVKGAGDKVLNPTVTGGFTVIAVVVIFICNIQPARANMMALASIRAISIDPVNALESMRLALAFNSPHIDDIRSDVSRTAAQVVGQAYQKLGKETSLKLLNEVIPAVQENLSLHPLDIRNHLLIAQLYGLEATLNQDRRYVEQAEQVLETALSSSPHRQQIAFSLATTKLQLGKVAEAVALLQQTISDDPRISEGYVRLAYTYKVAGQDNLAREILQKAQQQNVIFADSEQELVKEILSVPTTTSKVRK